MGEIARLLDSIFKALGVWVVMPAVAATAGIVLWTPSDFARRNGFEALRYGYGGWLFIVFCGAVALFLAACAVHLIPSLWERGRTALAERRRKAALRAKLETLTPDEVVVMFVLLTGYRDSFRAGDDSAVVRKLRMSGLVRVGNAAGLGWTAYVVPAEVWQELPAFKERWIRTVEGRGATTPESVQEIVRAILCLPSIEC